MYEQLRVPYQADSLHSTIQMGGIIVSNQLVADSPVNLVLKSFNRHGLVAGATGTGKTKTMQVLCEQLSLAGVPSLVMDIKGDVSGLAVRGENNAFIEQRCQALELAYAPRGFPVEILTLNSNSPGIPLRSTLTDFGSLLFSRMLGLNDTQAGIITILFEYARETHLPLIDLEDMKELLLYAQTAQGKSTITKRFGGISTSSSSTILRKIIDLESQGGATFFGEPAFDIMDLLRKEGNLGIISILRLLDMQDKPKLFSTFMLKLLTDIYRKLPELGDPPQPKLILFIDEAHLIFKNATKALLELIESTIKLIRSKGVGIFFCTQLPTDVPDVILSQLGLKVQHALRAFTAKDRTALKLVAQNFPPSKFYKTEQLLTDLGIGEALLSSLDERGQPTPLIECMVRAPASRMGILTDQELNNIVSASTLYPKYKQRENRSSAKEILSSQQTSFSQESIKKTSTSKEPPSIITTLSKNTLFRQLMRSITNACLKLITSFFNNKRR